MRGESGRPLPLHPPRGQPPGVFASQEVPVVVVELDALRAELATLDENVVRHELTELERAEMEARRREIYEMLYPLTKRGVVSNVRPRAQSKLSEVESDDVDQTELGSVRYESGALNPEGETAPTYIQYAAEREGVTDRAIRKRLRIAEKLHPEVRDYIRGTPLADDQRGAGVRITAGRTAPPPALAPQS